MPNILTAAEAANAVRTDVSDQAMLDLLPGVDDYIKDATGHNWATDSVIHPKAKSAARMLLVMWYDNPSQLAGGVGSLPQGLRAVLTQLEALARVLTFVGCSGAGSCALPGAEVGDQVAGLIAIAGGSGSAVVSFETVITVADEIQQISSSDLSTITYKVRLTSSESV